jgi:hypothetical protein
MYGATEMVTAVWPNCVLKPKKPGAVRFPIGELTRQSGAGVETIRYCEKAR